MSHPTSQSSSGNGASSEKTHHPSASKTKSRQERKSKNPVAELQNVKGLRGKTSVYKGVTRHKITGRFEARFWDNSAWNSTQTKKGRPGTYESELNAARVHDLAALKYLGSKAALNFPLESYIKDLEKMENITKEDYVEDLRRHSSGFSRGVSKYRGVSRHRHGGWEARIWKTRQHKDTYLGTFSIQCTGKSDQHACAILTDDLNNKRENRRGSGQSLRYCCLRRRPNAPTNFDKKNHSEILVYLKEKSQQTGSATDEAPLANEDLTLSSYEDFTSGNFDIENNTDILVDLKEKPQQTGSLEPLPSAHKDLTLSFYEDVIPENFDDKNYSEIWVDLEENCQQTSVATVGALPAADKDVTLSSCEDLPVGNFEGLFDIKGFKENAGEGQGTGAVFSAFDGCSSSASAATIPFSSSTIQNDEFDYLADWIDYHHYD